MKRAIASAAFMGVALVAIFANANAPADQYIPYDPVATSIGDQQTHLVWQRVLAQSPTDHTSAQAQCAQNSQRLPTYRELLTIVDEDGHPEWDPEAGASTLRYIDPTAFPGTPADVFWTMSPSPGGAKNGFKVVDFGSGETRDETKTAFYRCVIDAP